jgi:riboflavin transporter FmnP
MKESTKVLFFFNYNYFICLYIHQRHFSNFGTIPLKTHVLSPNYIIVIAIPFHMLSFPAITIHFPFTYQNFFPNEIAIPRVK